MRKIMAALAIAATLMFVITSDQDAAERKLPIPEQMIESVVIVNGSSGIIVYSDNEIALILTAYHIIKGDYEKAACSGCNYNINASFLRYVAISTFKIPYVEKYPAENIVVDEANDLAILQIKPRNILRYSKVSARAPALGDDIWIAANPNRTYRSLKKGIISSKDRSVAGSLNWEISGGIVFGSSGGGAFNMSGRLIGIIKAVSTLNTNQCYEIWNENGDLIGAECVEIPMTFIGFITPQPIIRNFLSNSLYRNYFKYLVK